MLPVNPLKCLSTYIAVAVWGGTGFMAQPTIASFLVHFFGVPVLLACVIMMAHWEGRRSERATHVLTP